MKNLMRVRQDPEFCPEKAEFWLEPEFWVNLSFAPNAQKKSLAYRHFCKYLLTKTLFIVLKKAVEKLPCFYSLVLLQHKSWMLQTWTRELKTIRKSEVQVDLGD